ERRRLRERRTEEGGVPPLQGPGRLGERRLPVDGGGRGSVLPAPDRRRAATPGPGGDRRRQGAARRGGRGDRGCGRGRRRPVFPGEARGGGLPCRPPGAAAPATHESCTAAAAASPRRGAPVR